MRKKIILMAVMFVGILTFLTGCGKNKYDEVKEVPFPENAELNYFMIHHEGMAMEPYYILQRSEKHIYLKYVTMNPEELQEEELAELQEEDSLIKELKEAIVQYGALGWDGYHEKVSGKGVLDSGDSYHLKIELSDGTSVTMYGYNTCPAGFESLLEQATDLFFE